MTSSTVLQTGSVYDYSDVYLSWGVHSYTESLDDLTKQLGVQPSRGWSAGEQYSGREWDPDTQTVRSVIRPKPFTLYCLETSEWIHSDRFEEHAQKLLDILEPAGNVLAEWLKTPSHYQIPLIIYLDVDKQEDFFGIGVDSSLLRRLTNICSSLEWRLRRTAIR